MHIEKRSHGAGSRQPSSSCAVILDKTSGESIEDSHWHCVTFYDRLAEIAGEYLKKGKPVYIEGRLKYGKYTDKDGMVRNTVDIVAEQMQMLGKRGCLYHPHHAQEEMFIVLEGHGTMRVAGEMLAVKAGDIVFVPPGPEYPHQMINTSDAPLKYLSLRALRPEHV